MLFNSFCSNKKLLEASASLIVTRALLLVTRSYLKQGESVKARCIAPDLQEHRSPSSRAWEEARLVISQSKFDRSSRNSDILQHTQAHRSE